MNGICLVIPKSYCPMYKFGTINKTNSGTSKKMDLIPCRLSNFHLPRISPLIATTRMLKHRVYCKNKTGSTSDVPEDVIGVVVPSVLGFGLGFIGWHLVNNREVVARFISTRGGVEGVLKSNTCYYILLGIAAVFVARGYIHNIMCGFAVLQNKPFSVGDKIELSEDVFLAQCDIMKNSIEIIKKHGATLMKIP